MTTEVIVTPERIQPLKTLADAVREWFRLHNEMMDERDGHEWFIKNEKVQQAMWQMETALEKLEEKLDEKDIRECDESLRGDG